MDLALRLEVNGEVRQRDRTSSLAWSTAELATWVDARTSLQAGDLILTGTPGGTGHESGRYLQPGDVVDASVECIGTLRNVVGRRLPH
jgi:2-keto-4-pentenoate hydratase/2-oxohepta-3-ene-1,7-dioic acid hydratase in catechol pathway